MKLDFFLFRSSYFSDLHSHPCPFRGKHFGNGDLIFVRWIHIFSKITFFISGFPFFGDIIFSEKFFFFEVLIFNLKLLFFLTFLGRTFSYFSCPAPSPTHLPYLLQRMRCFLFPLPHLFIPCFGTLLFFRRFDFFFGENNILFEGLIFILKMVQ